MPLELTHYNVERFIPLCRNRLNEIFFFIYHKTHSFSFQWQNYKMRKNR